MFRSKGIWLALLRVGFAIAIAILISQFHFDYIEALLYDARVRLTPTPATTDHVSLIAIDPLTVEKIGRVPSSEDHRKLLEHLSASGAKAIVYLISPNEIVGSNDELSSLADLMQKTPGFYVAVQDVALRGEENAFKLLPPFEKILPVSAPATSDRNIFAGDNVTRRIMISYQGQQMLHPMIARDFNPDLSDEKKIRGTFEYLQSTQAYIVFHPAGTYKEISFFDAISHPQTEARYKDKIVVVGRDIQSAGETVADAAD